MSLIDRRVALAGLGAFALAPLTPRIAAQPSRPLQLRAGPEAVALHPGERGTPAWALTAPIPVLRCKRGDRLDMSLQNDLPVPASISIRGLDGAADAEPLLAGPAVAPGAQERLSVPVRQAGTCLCELWLPDDGAPQPLRPLALIAEEDDTVAVDRDQVILIEGWRPNASGTAASVDAVPAATTYTVNGVVGPQLAVRGQERLRLRFINGCQRTVVAIKIEGYEVRVMAMDGQPAEPFFARNGALVLAPGGRADALLDGTAPSGSASPILLHDGTNARPIAQLVSSREAPMRPAALPLAPALPSNGLPAQLDLKGALRADLVLSKEPDWIRPAAFAATAAPAFQTRRGRTVVLTLGNPAGITSVFHLHGHHFRLLDQLDDGWKPFWLDTLAVGPGETQRIAFAAEHPGRFLLESFVARWATPRLVRWYGVE